MGPSDAKVAGRIDLANRLIMKEAMAATIYRKGAKTGTDYSPTFAADAEHSCFVVKSSFTDTEKLNSTITQKDGKYFVAMYGLTISPTVQDRILVDGITYEITKVDVLAPNGVPIFYTIRVTH